MTGPIGQFQASLLNREGVEYILVEIAKIVGVDEASIRKRLTNSWREEYETRFNSAKTAGGDEPVAERRGNDEISTRSLRLFASLRVLQRPQSPLNYRGKSVLCRPP